MSSKEKHTPGPWELGHAGGYNVVRFSDGDINGIAKCSLRDERLISAAPDLLEACELTVKHGNLFPRYVDEIMRSAIQKATGNEVGK